jgi:hypothetical protein
MPVATDITQRLREALTEALDTHARIVAITARANGNLIPWEDEGELAPPRNLPRIMYTVVSATDAGGAGDMWECTVQFSAFARTKAIACSLVEVVSRYLTATLLGSITVAPLKVMSRTNRQRRDGGYDPDNKHHREDLDITLLIQQEPPQ